MMSTTPKQGTFTIHIREFTPFVCVYVTLQKILSESLTAEEKKS